MTSTETMNRRQYVRHPIKVPLAIRLRDGRPGFHSRAGDLSEGGLSFAAAEPIAVGAVVDVDLPVGHSRFTLAGSVVSSTPLAGGGGHRIGLVFLDPEMSFRMKLAEQVLRIAELQQDLGREAGAEVSRDEAARIWVERYAEAFADLYPRSGG